MRNLLYLKAFYPNHLELKLDTVKLDACSTDPLLAPPPFLQSQGNFIIFIQFFFELVISELL